jgi:hypothetical protein
MGVPRPGLQPAIHVCKIILGVAFAAPFGSRATPKWRNWQTRMVQVHVPARVWGFESLLRHQLFSSNHFRGGFPPRLPESAILWRSRY